MRNSSRSWWVLAVFAVLAACGGDDDDDDPGQGAGLAPPACQPDGILRYVHDLGGAQVTGELPKGSSVFANKISADEPGYLEVGDLGGTMGGDRVRVAFQKLIAKGDSTDATGFFKIGDRQAGNCETTLVSRIRALPDDGWTVTLVDLHAPPFCGGAAIAGSFAACFIPEPF